MFFRDKLKIWHTDTRSTQNYSPEPRKKNFSFSHLKTDGKICLLSEFLGLVLKWKVQNGGFVLKNLKYINMLYMVYGIKKNDLPA